MGIRNILKKGDSGLEKKSREVKDFNQRLHTLLDDMRETLIEMHGLGLAAPQVGVLRKAVLVMDISGEEEEIIELINPEILETGGEQEGPEGCLSVPNVWGIVKRPLYVKVRAQDRFGNTFEVEGEGITARAFCHEIDHLGGTLFVDICEKVMSAEELEQMYAEIEEAETEQ